MYCTKLISSTNIEIKVNLHLVLYMIFTQNPINITVLIFHDTFLKSRKFSCDFESLLGLAVPVD